VGESGSSLAILQALRDQGFTAPVLLSAATPTGLDLLEEAIKAPAPDLANSQANSLANSPALLGPQTQISAPPLDFLGAPGRFLDRVAPRALVVIETEIWPELYHQCRLRSIPVLMLSARLSRRSHGRLGRFRRFIGQTLAVPALAATIGQTDLEFLTDLGLDPAKAAALGSPKFDRLVAQAQAGLAAHKAHDLSGPWPQPPLILAGSTHPGEEVPILAAALRLSGKGLDSGPAWAIAPRHLTRLTEVLRLIESFGWTPSLYSETESLRPEPGQVTVVDRMGLLASLYGQGDLAIVGGSFVDGGTGHNPLEPAAAGKPVFFGPHMDSFKAEAEALIARGAAITAPKNLLADALSPFLDDPQKSRQAGLAGLRYLAEKPVVAPALASLVIDYLSEPAPDGPRKALDRLRALAQRP
jgi:3-deoxy-D-manno-octulosonic-acid transferase